MSKEEIAEVIGMLTEVLENVNLEISKLMTETKDRFEPIENHMLNLVKDHEDFKESNTKSHDNNERNLGAGTSLKEKEEVIDSIIESFTYQQ